MCNQPCRNSSSIHFGHTGLVISSTQTGRLDRSDSIGASFDRPSFGRPSFDDDVLTSAQHQARILRELGYRTEAAHIERFVDRQTPAEEAPAA